MRMIDELIVASNIRIVVSTRTTTSTPTRRPLRRALRGARPPGLMLVGEPDELGLESAHPQLALRARLIELAEADGHVAADDDRTPTRLDDDHLQTARVARRRYEAEPWQQLELAVDRLVVHARRIDPLADRVFVLRARVLELLPLNIDRASGEQMVAAAVVEVQVRVDDDVDAGEVEGVLAQRDQTRVHVGHLRPQLRHAGVDQHAGVGMVDDVDADRPALALDEQLGDEQRRDRGRRHSPILPAPATCLPSRLSLLWRRHSETPAPAKTSASEPASLASFSQND